MSFAVREKLPQSHGFTTLEGKTKVGPLKGNRNLRCTASRKSDNTLWRRWLVFRRVLTLSLEEQFFCLTLKRSGSG